MTGHDRDFYWYWFLNIRGIGNRLRSKLLERFGHPRYIYEAGKDQLEEILTASQTRSLYMSRDDSVTDENLRMLTDQGIRFIHWESEDYPSRFRNLYDPPYGFYLKGSLPEEDHPAVAIVGSRNPTRYGEKMTSWFSEELASHGVAIISGMAAGVDSTAHRCALKVSGSTLGILGGGIDSMYPRENWDLYLDMYEKAGIMSEYNLGVVNKAGLFPMRNRLISGIADAVLVVEAATKSGSLITADLGMEQGREVYAVPGRISDKMSEGCNHLIAQGASMAVSPKSLLENLITGSKIQRFQFFAKESYDLSEEENSILEALDLAEPVSFDELIRRTSLDWKLLQHHLVDMEMKSWILQPQQNMYLKNI